MRIFEVMTENVQTVSPRTAAGDAWELMWRKRIHHLVVRDAKRIVGVISDRDVGGRAGAAVRAGRTVGDLMSSQVVTAAPQDTVKRLASLMRGRSIGCAPVVDRDRLVGIVTVSDLLDLLGRGMDRPVRPGRPTATHRAPHRKRRGGPAAW